MNEYSKIIKRGGDGEGKKVKKIMRKKNLRIENKIPHSQNTSGPAESDSVCVNVWQIHTLNFKSNIPFDACCISPIVHTFEIQ